MNEEKKAKSIATSEIVASFRLGLLQATLFCNQPTGGEGSRTHQSVSLERSYRDADGEWQTTKLSLFVSDLSTARSLLNAIEQKVLTDQQ